MELKPHLLDSALGGIRAPADLNACINAHGLYNSEQFVLRLSPEVHRRVAALSPGIQSGGLHADDLQAYSTYIHETIHWWQHVGSTIGLMLSLSYPAQAHANYSHLKTLLQQIGPKKSLLRWVEREAPGSSTPDTPGRLANTVVNNYFDIDFFRILVTRPHLIRQVAEHQFFECVGHSYEVAYGNMLLILAATLGEEFRVTDDPRQWEPHFAALREQKVRGYHYRSDVTVSPIGAYQLFEGQARFGQLQFLYFGSSGRLTWDDVRARGMLGGVYGEAFDTFLQLSGLAWPGSIDDSVVALFLLVCDIAMNPGAGFPLPLHSFSTFIDDVDPGVRFLLLCRVIATKRPDLATAITSYSREEYVDVCEALTEPLLLDSPVTIARTVSQWPLGSPAVDSLMHEHKTFAYGPGNLPVRLLLAHFVAFSKDKYSNPEFFCWPGAWMVGDRVSTAISSLFERNSAPFLDKPDDAGIYPRLMSERSEATVQETFERFYAVNVTYDMTRQWIVTAGPFRYDYRFLSSSGSDADMKGFGDRHFEMLYGITPDRFEII